MANNRRITDLEEFYAIADLSDFEKLRDELSAWQFFYNWQRPHGSLGGKSPSDIVGSLGEKTPLWEAVLNYFFDILSRKRITQNRKNFFKFF